MVRYYGDTAKANSVYACAAGSRWARKLTGSGMDPLTPADIAEVVVFAAGRPENVVLAETVVFPSHQVPLCSLSRVC